MKSLRFLTSLASVVTMAIASSVFAQPSDATSSSTVPQANTSTAATRAADKQLAKAVRSILVKTRGLDASGIQVRARGGSVVLKGSVSNAAQIDKAGDVAKTVPGVVSVTNKLIAAPHEGQGR